MTEPHRTAWYRAFDVRSIYSDEFLETVDRWEGIVTKPNTGNRSRREGIQILANPFLDYALTKAHPSLPWVWTLPFVAFGLYRGMFLPGGPLRAAGWFGLGVLLWTAIEYGLHRGLFHLRFPERMKVFAFLAHGYHHEFPDDRMRLVAPPLMFWSLGAAFGLLFYYVFGPQIWATAFAGTMAGYLAYDSLHFYTHHARPRHRVGRWLRRYHLLHHFRDGESRYGISSPLWDLILRTDRSAGE